jgi:transcriptional regulator
MGGEQNLVQGTLSLMILKTLEVMEPLHGYGIARRIEQTGGTRLTLNYGTVYPMLLKLEQEGAIAAKWGVSENNRRARYYRLTALGRRRIAKESQQWEDAAELMRRCLAPEGGK